MSTEINFVGKDVSEADKLLFLGPITEQDGPFVEIGPDWSMGHLMHAAGIFPSVKQAKKNGWDKPIPTGYSEASVGKKKFKIYILTKFD